MSVEEHVNFHYQSVFKQNLNSLKITCELYRKLIPRAMKLLIIKIFNKIINNYDN